ncbi:MAG: hypothetical protein H8D23_18935 [Candidatus Brocadiales bacterium]|nr:hypothetical protein [Candidatus Brocadiales bacterium]
MDLNEWVCVQVAHHKRISKTIQGHQEKGWKLHSYEATALGETVHHFLLFEKTSKTD